MARLQPPEPRGLDLMRRMTSAWTRRTYGRAMEPAEVLAHSRPLLFGVSAVGLALDRFAKSAPASLKHLAMLRSSQLVGCEWCLDFGSWLAQQDGVDQDQLRELSYWRESARFDDDERLVLEYAEAMSRTPVEVSDELFERLRARFEERQIVELTMAIALENMYSRSNWALGIEGQGFTEGMYCVRPESSLVGGSAAR
jgi:AhpD family alkylhydroperoxidase